MSIKLIENRIIEIRGQKVILDYHLADLYEVDLKILLQAVQRNIDRFPKDFMFKLSLYEFHEIRDSDSEKTWGGRRKPPNAFTEQGIAMLSSVLNSKRAIRMNIEIMRAFVRYRKMLINDPGLLKKLNELEENYASHDKQIQSILRTIRLLLSTDTTGKRLIGFGRNND